MWGLMNITYINIKAWHGHARLLRGKPQYIELKQLADLEAEFRRHCRMTIHSYRRWKQAYGQEGDLVASHYRGLEGALLKRQARNAVRLYLIVRKDFRCGFRNYIERRLHTKF